MNNVNKYPVDNGLQGLIRAAHEQPAVPERLEQRIMLEIARRAIARSKRKAKMGLIASLSGLGMLLAGCVITFSNWFPHYLPFLEFLRISELFAKLPEIINLPPFIEQWGFHIIVLLLTGSAAGFIYYLNNLFSNSFPEE